MRTLLQIKCIVTIAILHAVQFLGFSQTTINSYIYQKGTWISGNTTEVAIGEDIILGPQPLGGSWQYFLPDGSSANTRELAINSIHLEQLGTYYVTYTDANGKISTTTFNLTLKNDNTNFNALIGDPGFENNGNNWNLWGGAQITSANVKSGANALNLLNFSGAELYIDGLQPSTTYKLKGWLRTTNGNEIRLGVKNHGGNEQWSSTKSSVYTELEVVFTTGIAHRHAIIYCYAPSGSTGLADDISISGISQNEYSMVWSDEFNNEGNVNKNIWNFENGFLRNNENQWYQEENAWQENGNLVIEARKETKPNPWYNPNSSNEFYKRQNIEYTSSSIN